LGLPAIFEIDPGSLDSLYFRLQQKLHPDRFIRKTARERALSQSQAMALNEAYETLKDPFRRADYLIHLKRQGEPAEGCNLVNDQDLLTESMEMREALADAETVNDITLIASRAESDIDACVDALSAAFAGDDLDTASRLATRLKYLRKLAEECHQYRSRLAKAL
jgi:molecular chaperone HscB